LAWQTITEIEDWRNGSRREGAVEISALFGDRAKRKRRAFKKAMEYVPAA